MLVGLEIRDVFVSSTETIVGCFVSLRGHRVGPYMTLAYGAPRVAANSIASLARQDAEDTFERILELIGAQS